MKGILLGLLAMVAAVVVTSYVSAQTATPTSTSMPTPTNVTATVTPTPTGDLPAGAPRTGFGM